MSRRFERDILKALGLDGQRVRRLALMFGCEESPIVEVERIVTESEGAAISSVVDRYKLELKNADVD